MSVNISSQYSKRDYTWTAWKAIYAIKCSPFQYDDDGTLYTIWAYDGPEVHVCQIWKSILPDSITTTLLQTQNDNDKTDFETNFKSLGNLPLTQLDIDGAQIVRMKAAKKGWSFWAVPIEFTTSVLGAAIYCKDRNDTNIPGITGKIYDASNAEITTTGVDNINLSSCVKTVIDFEPPYDYELIGGSLRINSNPGTDVRLWIIGAPDIPASYGGSKEFASGINLKYLAPNAGFDIDGRVTKYLTYNPTNHSGKMRFILKHPTGTQVNLQITIQVYRL